MKSQEDVFIISSILRNLLTVNAMRKYANEQKYKLKYGYNNAGTMSSYSLKKINVNWYSIWSNFISYATISEGVHELSTEFQQIAA